MEASPSPQASEPDDSPPGTRTYITGPEPGDASAVLARFRCVGPDGWTATGTLGRSWRGLVISRMEIEPDPEVDDEPGMISSALLRHIPTGAILAAAQAALGTSAPVEPERSEKRQPGRQPLSDELLRDVAERYLAETAPGKPRGAIQRLAEHYAKPAQTISRWVMRARSDGWLGPAISGREGGEPGPRLSRVIPNRPRYPRAPEPPAE